MDSKDLAAPQVSHEDEKAVSIDWVVLFVIVLVIRALLPGSILEPPDFLNVANYKKRDVAGHLFGLPLCPQILRRQPINRCWGSLQTLRSCLAVRAFVKFWVSQYPLWRR